MDNGLRIDFKDMARVVGETWRTLTSKERAPYEVDARREMAQYEQDRKKYEEKHKIWADLHHKTKTSGQLERQPLKHLLWLMCCCVANVSCVTLLVHPLTQ